MMKNTISIRDRNHVAYLLTLGFICEFVPQPGGAAEALFEHSVELEAATRDYMSNCSVAILTFVSASKNVSDRIRQCRQGVR